MSVLRRAGRAVPLLPLAVVAFLGACAKDAPQDTLAPEGPSARLIDNLSDPVFGIAGIVLSDPQVGEAFTLLTAPPGPDVAPYHDRQIVVLSPEDCQRWLDPAVPAGDLVRTLPAGTLAVTRG